MILFNKIRKTIAYLIEPSMGKLISFFYELIMLLLVIFSILPLMFAKGQGPEFIESMRGSEWIFLTIFLLDWFLRWITSDIRWPDKYEKWGWKQFLIYPFTLWSVIDLVAIIPSFFPGLGWFKAFRSLRILKTVRISPIIYSGVTFVFRSIFREWKALMMVFITLSLVVFIGAIILFQIEYEENEKISTFPDALWFVFITVTTIGYGDITPVTPTGKVMAGFFAILGIMNMALITGIAVAGFTLEIQDLKKGVKDGTIEFDKRKLAIKKKTQEEKKKKRYTSR